MVGLQQQQQRLKEQQQQDCGDKVAAGGGGGGGAAVGIEQNGNSGANGGGGGSNAVQSQQQHQQPEQQQQASSNGTPGSPRARLAMLKRSSTKSKAVSNSDPFRFQGDGVDFKGKLIGVRDVDEARGDAMCAEAMRLAKAAVKSAGHHKQRIILNISIEGLKIKDEKTQTVLHNFPVSRISFIARDTTDARAFGFIYGCSDNKYKFYGIKTAQTADRAVLSIRDMFQIVFEMKKAQLAEVKQKQEEQQKRESEMDGVRIDNGVAVADLLDLESELHNIEQGYNQLQNIPAFAEDSWPSNDVFATMQPSAPFHPVTSGTVAPFPPPPVSSFGLKNPADPFDNSFNPRSAPVVSPPAITPLNAFNVQQPSSFSTQPLTSAWPNSDAFASATTNRPIAFSETNPFASAVHGATVARIEPDPFDTQQAQRVLEDSASYHRPPAVSWPTNENTVPPVGADSRTSQWTEKKRVSTLEEAFNKLVDMDALVSGPELKKNPFDELMNPPKKIPIGAMSTMTTAAPTMMTGAPRAPCIPARTTAPLIVTTTANNDPFNDEFFN